jgi:hypothetical protein
VKLFSKKMLVGLKKMEKPELKHFKEPYQTCPNSPKFKTGLGTTANIITSENIMHKNIYVENTNSLSGVNTSLTQCILYPVRIRYRYAWDMPWIRI